MCTLKNLKKFGYLGKKNEKTSGNPVVSIVSQLNIISQTHPKVSVCVKYYMHKKPAI